MLWRRLRRERRKKRREPRAETPAEWVAYFFLVEIAGKRAAILVLVGCQRVHDFGPEKAATGEAGSGKRPRSLGNWAAKGGLSVVSGASTSDTPWS
jgi:hypothetical protein